MSRRFECTECGACCRRPGIVVITDDELRRIARYRETTAHELVLTHEMESHPGEWWMHLLDGECPFLENDRCSIHPVKPNQCRTYPFWPEIVEESGAWEAEKEFCPGIGRGREWNEGEVQELLDSLDDP